MNICAKSVIVFLCVICFALGEITQSEDGTSGSIKFTPPDLNDEEAHSMHMPSQLKCDACTAVAFQFTSSFAAVHEKRKSIKTLPESELYRIVEEVCEGEELSKYGIKELKGEKRLSGPGTEAGDAPGIMQGGGRWPERMKRVCSRYVEELEEEGIYEAWHDDPDNLKDFLCNNKDYPGLTDYCSPKSETAKRGKKKAKREDL